MTLLKVLKCVRVEDSHLTRLLQHPRNYVRLVMVDVADCHLETGNEFGMKRNACLLLCATDSLFIFPVNYLIGIDAHILLHPIM
jgi:hypothetical protein